MFALLALIVFILALFNVQIDSINMLFLGLAFIAAHMLWNEGSSLWSFSKR